MRSRTSVGSMTLRNKLQVVYRKPNSLLDKMTDAYSSLVRSPRCQTENFQNVVVLKLDREAQKQLGCSLNEEVFLECPYAFVPRQVLRRLSQQVNSPLECIFAKINEFPLEEVLVGYAGSKLSDTEPVDFTICLTEESQVALISLNRSITIRSLEIVRNQISKHPKPWKKLGDLDELGDDFLKNSRNLLEAVVTLPLFKLRRNRALKDRSPHDIRDGYVQLLEDYETFKNVEFTTLSRACQTNLFGKNQEAQTYHGNPKNKWTQYEFVVPEEFSNVWSCEQQKEIDEKEDNDKENTSDNEEDQEIAEEQLQLEQKRTDEWNKLNEFLTANCPYMITEVSINATTNLYKDDVASLSGYSSFMMSGSRNWCKEIACLIDLKTVRNRSLFSATWHCELSDIIACAYLDSEARHHSLVAIWSFFKPLRPKYLLDCKERISVLKFCPTTNYTNVLIGGCLEGKIVIWEVNRHTLIEEHNNKMVVDFSNKSDKVTTVEARFAVSSEKSQRKCISCIQWLPNWCHVESDGNFQRTNSSLSKDHQKVYFATSSIEGTIFFWSLPKMLSSPALARSPLHLTISPIYKLVFEDKDEKSISRISVTCFSLPLAKTEESSSLRIRGDSDLERLRRVFVGTSLGEILHCTWESMTLALDPSDREICKISSRCPAHDGPVKCMVKSPHLDDIFLTVGGNIFAVWNEDFANEPIFKNRSLEGPYGEGCWSGRPGLLLLTNVNGGLELWDLKRRCHEPIMVQTVSSKMTPSIYPSPSHFQDKLLAILDGTCSLRLFQESAERAKNEDLERLEWFEEYSWRETRRKRDFSRWQDEYLSKNPVALSRRAEREQAEIHRKHEEARKKFIELFGLIVMIFATNVWVLFVGICCFIMTTLWTLVYLVSLREVIRLPINWLLTELVNTAIYAVFYFTAFVVSLATYWHGAVIVSKIFCIFNTLAYAAGTYFLFLEHKSGQ